MGRKFDTIERSELMTRSGIWCNTQVLIDQHVNDGVMLWREWCNIYISEAVTAGSVDDVALLKTLGCVYIMVRKHIALLLYVLEHIRTYVLFIWKTILNSVDQAVQLIPITRP